MKPTWPIDFLHSLHGYWPVVHVLILVLNWDSLSSLSDWGISSQILGAKEERLSVSQKTIMFLFLNSILLFLKSYGLLTKWKLLIIHLFW